MAEPADLTARLAPVLGQDGNVDLLKLARINARALAGQTLTEAERAALDAVLADPMAARILTAAAVQYEDHCEQQVRKRGGTIYRQRVRVRDGHTSYSVHRSPRSRERGGATPVRTRGSRRSTASSSSSSSSDPPGLADEPPRPPVALGRGRR